MGLDEAWAKGLDQRYLRMMEVAVCIGGIEVGVHDFTFFF
jgi:hypothetical protein